MSSDAVDRPLQVLVCGTITTEPIESALLDALTERRLRAEIRHAPFNQVHATLLGEVTGSDGCDVLVVLWRMEDFLASSLAVGFVDPEKARRLMEEELMRLADAARAFASRSTATLIVSTPPLPHVRPLGLLDSAHPGGVAALHSECLVMWRRLAQSVPGLLLLDLDGVARELGEPLVLDTRLLYLARLPWTRVFLRAMSARIARLVAASRAAPKKVLVLDCDNTLWGGVVGEDGPLGVEIGDEGVGAAFQAFQAYLLALRGQGLLLALASKNNEPDVWEVFEKNPGMLLRREHFAATRINWDPKSRSLRAMAVELNLGLDSFVFIDDNQVEGAEVSASEPEVTTLVLPEDPADFLLFLGKTEALDRLTLTAEDLERAQRYSEEQARSVARGRAGSMDEYLQGLGVRVAVELVVEETVPRVAQLTNKTNQFNLTTIRRSEAEVRALIRDGRWSLFAVRVEDRFGNYGLTGAAFVKRFQEAWDIDTFLLSCRVLSRGVETALMAHLTTLARKEGVFRLTARYRPTAKNSVAAGFLAASGFSLIGDLFVLETSSSAVTAPKHIVLDSPA